jgi:hypothetical protein
MTARMRTLSRPELQNGEREVSGLWVGHPFEIGHWSSPWRAAILSDTLKVEKCTYSPTGRALFCGYEFIRYRQPSLHEGFTCRRL